MGFCLEGEVYIPVEDFWEFVYKTCADKVSVDDPLFRAPRIHIHEEDPVMRFDVCHHGSNTAVETVDLCMVDFWSFAESFLPHMPANTQFGVPRLDRFDLTIDYVANTEASPREMSTLPKAVIQWENAPDVIWLNPADTGQR